MATRYLKHNYVDGNNPQVFLTNTNVGTDGKTHPKIKNLDVKVWASDNNGIDYCLSVLEDDSVNLTAAQGLEILSFSEWANECETAFNKVISQNNLQDENFSINKTSLATIEESFHLLYNHINETTNT